MDSITIVVITVIVEAGRPVVVYMSTACGRCSVGRFAAVANSTVAVLILKSGSCVTGSC